jgi:hypothetical protein
MPKLVSRVTPSLQEKDTPPSQSLPVSSLPVGHTLIAQRYRLDEKLGAGGMGIVWRATDLELGRVVALKRSQSGDGGQIRREARIGAGLQHPNVVTVYDAVVHEHDRWLVMEYLRARSLAAILDDDGPLPPEDVARIGAQLASALAAMHAKGMVHRDLKPGNVLVAEDGTAKLTDLGIARWADETGTDAHLVGTPGYLAPEVADGVTSGTAAADMFALGATLFAAVEGSSPWGERDTPFRQLRRAAAFELEPAHRAGPLAPVLDALLQRQPSARPSAKDATRMLANVSGTTVPGTSRHGFRLSRTVIALGAAAVVAAGAVVFWPDDAITADTTGDPRTADPCGMFDLDVFRAFGEPSLARDGGRFNDCHLLIRRNDNDEDVIDIRAFLELPGFAPLRRPEPGKIEVPEQTPVVDGDCGRFVTLPDGNVFTVGVTHWSGWSAPLCEVADQAIVHAVEVLNRGQIPRRPHPHPADSLARVDACSLLDEADVVASLGKDVAGEPTFAAWECDWLYGPKEVHITFDRDDWPMASDERREITVGTRAAFVQEGTSGWPDSCQVEIAYKRVGDEQQWVETVELYIEREGTTPAENCAEAEAMAGVIDDRLPRSG